MADETIEGAMNVLSAALTEYDTIAGCKVPKRDKPIRRPDPDLKWWTDTDFPYGWSIHHGYSLEWDDGRASVWIHKSELDDGKTRTLVHLPEDDVNAIESTIAEEVEAEAEVAARALAEAEDDRGDWEYERRKDRDAMRGEP